MVDCINKLHDNEYEVQIITSRANTTRQDALGALFRKMLVDKLKEYNLKYDESEIPESVRIFESKSLFND